jgi:hypothetical protein
VLRKAQSPGPLTTTICLFAGLFLQGSAGAAAGNIFDAKTEKGSAELYFHYYGMLMHQQNMLQVGAALCRCNVNNCPASMLNTLQDVSSAAATAGITMQLSCSAVLALLWRAHAPAEHAAVAVSTTLALSCSSFPTISALSCEQAVRLAVLQAERQRTVHTNQVWAFICQPQPLECMLMIVVILSCVSTTCLWHCMLKS